MAIQLPPGFVLESSIPDPDRPLPAPATSDPASLPAWLGQSPLSAAPTASPAAPAGPPPLPPGFELEAPKKVDLGRGIVGAATDVPVLGPAASYLNAAVQAAIQPAVGGEGFSSAKTFAERLRENIKLEKERLEGFAEQRPITSTAANVVGAGALTLPIAAAPAGAAALGFGGKTMAGQIARMAGSGAAIGGVDALERGQDPTIPALVGGGVGGIFPPAGKAVGAVVGKVTGSTAARAAEEQAAREAAARRALSPEEVIDVPPTGPQAPGGPGGVGGAAGVAEAPGAPAGAVPGVHSTPEERAAYVERLNEAYRAFGRDRGIPPEQIEAQIAAAMAGRARPEAPPVPVGSQTLIPGLEQPPAVRPPEPVPTVQPQTLIPGLERPPAAPLEGLPAKPIDLGEAGIYTPGPFQAAHDAASDYAKAAGIEYSPIRTHQPVDVGRAAKIAHAFEQMAHEPDHPAVKASYDALINETEAQWKAIQKTGLKVEFIKPGQADPYAKSPRMAAQDVQKNNHLWVFPTKHGFGGQGAEGAAEHLAATKANPMLRPMGEIAGRQVVANDIFRIVHDYFGHIMHGTGFRAAGEENAWRSHSAMYSPLARPAMTAETRGQNSWVNYGPHGPKNQTASGADTVYAPQKVGLLPDWVMEEGRLDPAVVGAAARPAPQAVGQAAARAPGATVPESVATLKAQQAQLTGGERPAMLFPGGKGELALPEGMKRVQIGSDVYHYDPSKITPAQVLEAIKSGREGQLLGLGPVNKAEVAQRAAAGETPVAVVERNPAGTEVRAAAGTDVTAPAQVQTLEAGKSPGNTVGVEQPGKVIAERNASQAPTVGDRPLFEGTQLTTNSIKDAAQSLYQAIDKEGIRINPDATIGMINRMANELRAGNFRPAYQPAVFRVLRRIAERETQGGSSFGDLMADLQYLNGLRTGIPDKNYAAAGIAKRAIEGFLGNVKTGDVLAGDPQKAVRMLQEANKNWAVFRGAEKLELALSRGRSNAATSGNGKSNYDNNIRQAFKPILRAIEEKKLRYPPDVEAAIRQVVTGSGKGMRTLAKFAPTGAVAIGADALLGNDLGLGSPGAIALAGAGLLARRRVNTVTTKRALAAIQAARAHAPAEQKFQSIFGSLAPK